MSRPRGSSRSWVERQARDTYVRRAQREGWRSRAVYKLAEICKREPLLQRGMTCIDLGAAPGGWSQYVASETAGQATIVAVDLLPMDPIEGVEFLLGDFSTDEVLADILARVRRGERRPCNERYGTQYQR